MNLRRTVAFSQRGLDGVILILFLAVLLVQKVDGQGSIFGAISGLVTDPTGAPIPGAQLTLKNEERGTGLTMVTNSAGSYEAASLPVGSYTLTVTQKGFKTASVSGLRAEAARRLIHDFRLEVGEIAESVTVAAVTNQVDTASGAIANLITGEEVGQLLMNGRNFQKLAVLTPGVTYTGTSFSGACRRSDGRRFTG